MRASTRARARQRKQLLCSQQRPWAIDPPCLFEQAADQFLDSISPTVSNLIDHTNKTHTSLTQLRKRTDNVRLSLDLARAEQVAQQGVRSVLSDLLTVGKYGQLEKVKPNKTICIMFKKISSLCLFVQGKEKVRKICQINKLMKEYSVDVMSGCKTRVDWRFTKPRTDGFNSLFAQGQQRHGVCAHNINEYVRWDQWGGICLVSVGWISTIIVATGIDMMGLGRRACIYMGGGGKAMRILVAYRPCQPHPNIRSNTVWDQHL
jgi:hypothetical protein